MNSLRPQPNGHHRAAPQFGLPVLESLETWRKAIRHSIERDRELKHALPQHRGQARANSDRARHALAKARFSFESMLKAHVESECA